MAAALGTCVLVRCRSRPLLSTTVAAIQPRGVRRQSSRSSEKGGSRGDGGGRWNSRSKVEGISGVQIGPGLWRRERSKRRRQLRADAGWRRAHGSDEVGSEAFRCTAAGPVGVLSLRLGVGQGAHATAFTRIFFCMTCSSMARE